MKKIMILGAGIYQLPLIKKAKELKLYTIVASKKGNYPGFEFADRVYYVDTTDINQILHISKTENIDGIVTSGTDVAVPTIGKVCDELGLHGVNYNAANRANIKSLMKDAFIEHGVKTARHVLCYDVYDAEKALSILKMPVVFKAVDSSGSRGIIRISSKDLNTIEHAIEIIRRVSNKDYFIVEEFIEGIEFGAQALVCNGELKFFMPHGDYVFKGDIGVPVGHFVPYDLDEEILKEAKKQLILAIKALGIDKCAINADFILSGDDVYVLEVGARSGATCLAEMVSAAYGIDYYKIILDVALNGNCNAFIQDELTPVVAKLITSEVDGVISKIEFPNIKSDNVLELKLDYNIGDRINAFRVGPDRIGDIIVKGDTLKAAQLLIEELMNGLLIDIEQR